MPDISLDGEINKQSVDDVISRLAPGDRLVINSRGGSLEQADRLSKFIRENNIDTHANSTAWVQSTAVLVYSAGHNRTAGENVLFGVHPMLKDGKIHPEATKYMFDRLLEHGVRNDISSYLYADGPRTLGYKGARGIGLVNTDIVK